MSSSSESVKIASTSSTSADMPTAAAATKKFMNLQTQHGNEMTADEENIVVFGRSISPIRNSSDELVWHWDIDVGAKKDEDEYKDDEDVSTAFFIPYNRYTSSSHCRWDVDVVSGRGLLPKTSDVYRVSNYDKIENWW